MEVSKNMDSNYRRKSYWGDWKKFMEISNYRESTLSRKSATEENNNKNNSI